MIVRTLNSAGLAEEPMKLQTEKALYAIGALVFPLALTWLGASSSFWVESIRSDGLLTLGSYVFAIAGGIWLVFVYPYDRARSRIWVLVLYVPCVLVAVYMTALMTACSYGDCI